MNCRFCGGNDVWEVGVLPGPNAAPDYFTTEDMDTFYSAPYTVHYNSCTFLCSLLLGLTAVLIVHAVILAMSYFAQPITIEAVSRRNCNVVFIITV